MLSTRFTELVGCKEPVQQAGMGPISGPDLAVAVSRAGGLGMVTLTRAVLADEAITGIVGRLHEQTNGVFGVNCLLPITDRQLVELVAPSARVVDFFWGDP